MSDNCCQNAEPKFFQVNSASSGSHFPIQKANLTKSQLPVQLHEAPTNALDLDPLEVKRRNREREIRNDPNEETRKREIMIQIIPEVTF